MVMMLMGDGTLCTGPFYIYINILNVASERAQYSSRTHCAVLYTHSVRHTEARALAIVLHLFYLINVELCSHCAQTFEPNSFRLTAENRADSVRALLLNL